MLKNILSLEGVSELTKKQQSSLVGGQCTCGIPKSLGGGSIVVDDRKHREARTARGCFNYCDNYRESLRQAAITAAD